MACCALSTASRTSALASDSVTSAWELGVRAHFIRFLSVGLSYAFIEDDRRTTLNVRFSF